MNWLILILVVVVSGGIYTIAKQRGKRERSEELSDRAAELDREEIENELEEKRNSNAWDNLNDTLDDLGK